MITTDYPFTIIESKIGKRNQFDMTDGKQPTHALFFLKEGNFIMKVDGGISERIAEGDCVIFSDYIHFNRSVSSPIVFVYIKFAINDKIGFKYELPFGKISFKNKERFLSSITTLEKLIESENSFDSLYKNHLLNDIMLQIINENTPKSANIADIILNDSILFFADKYIKDNLNKKISISDVCKSSNTNPSTLNHRFRKITGLSAGMYITNERMKKARRLLRSTSFGIREIAVRCGFDDVYYFSNAFKKHHGVSPTDFRKQ